MAYEDEGAKYFLASDGSKAEKDLEACAIHTCPEVCKCIVQRGAKSAGPPVCVAGGMERGAQPALLLQPGKQGVGLGPAGRPGLAASARPKTGALNSAVMHDLTALKGQLDAI